MKDKKSVLYSVKKSKTFLFTRKEWKINLFYLNFKTWYTHIFRNSLDPHFDRFNFFKATWKTSFKKTP